MPTYEYACKSCGEHVEVVQSFKDDALTECPACGGPLRKVFGNIGIAFKGSGFYKTDNRKSAEPARASSGGDSGSSSSSSSGSGGESGSGSGSSGDGAKKSESTGTSKPAATTSGGGSAPSPSAAAS
jgi:putative FmdB family regulatory protein